MKTTNLEAKNNAGLALQQARELPNSTALSAGLEPNNMLSIIERIVNQPGVDIDKIGKLLEYQTQWEQKEAKKSFFKSLANFQKDMPKIIKTKTISFGVGDRGVKYQISPFSDTLEAVSDCLSANGFSYRFEQVQNGNIKITCILTHSQGHSEKTSLEGKADTSGAKNALQAIGSTVTYLKRYTFEAALGLAPAAPDTDGIVEKVASNISTDQLAILVKLLEKSSANKEVFLQSFGIDKLHLMPLSQFGQAVKMLNTKIKRQQS